MMTIKDTVLEKISGDQQTKLVQDGTTLVTRGLGALAIALIALLYLLDQLDQGWWSGLDARSKLAFVLACGAIWSIVAAADTLARGIVSASQRPQVTALPATATATITTGKDSPGWTVLAVQADGDGQNASFLVVKGTQVQWVPAKDLAFDGHRSNAARP